MLEPKWTPIIFAGNFVRDILADVKLGTCRPVRPQPEPDPLRPGKHWWRCAAAGTMLMVEDELRGPDPTFAQCFNPLGRVGDRLWVRETWAGVNHLAGAEMVLGPELGGVRYRATWEKSHSVGWRPSIHMPRWASRITLEVTGGRFLRVRDLTRDDARRQGFRPAGGLDELGVFRASWDAFYAAAGLGIAANPWVWDTPFRRIEAGKGVAA